MLYFLLRLVVLTRMEIISNGNNLTFFPIFLFSAVLTAKSLTTSITITGLSPLSTYEFRVCAYNELGGSPFTAPLVLTTEMEGKKLKFWKKKSKKKCKQKNRARKR